MKRRLLLLLYFNLCKFILSLSKLEKEHYLNNLHTNRRMYSPKLDVVFQALFGEIGSENITKRFLENILETKIKSVDLSRKPHFKT